MKVLHKWFGDETQTEDKTTETDEDKWGVVDRRKKNKQKKKKTLRKKTGKEEQTLDKARHILGLGPIRRSTLTDNTEKNFEKVKRNAINELLKNELSFNEEELENMTIQETMTSSKDNGFIYCAFGDLLNIKKIHLRMAESQNDSMKTCNFIPPQLYERFRELGRICGQHETTGQRNKNTTLVWRS